MTRYTVLSLTSVLLLLAMAPSSASPGEPDLDLRIGGVGGVYLLAEPGELVIDLEKRDRNRSSAPTELRAILAGPDRRVVQEVVIPDDGSSARGELGAPLTTTGSPVRKIASTRAEARWPQSGGCSMR